MRTVSFPQGGGQWPLTCDADALGGRAVAHVVGVGTDPSGTFNNPIQLTGTASATIFQQPGAISQSVFAAYTFQIVVGPQVSGDTFKFTLKQVNTCNNSSSPSSVPPSGPCVTANATVAGATTIKGKLENGQKITATQPVVITVTESVSASNVIPTWTERIGTTIEITPLKEAPTPAQLDDLDDITSIDDGRSYQGVV